MTSHLLYRIDGSCAQQRLNKQVCTLVVTLFSYIIWFGVFFVTDFPIKLWIWKNFDQSVFLVEVILEK